MKIRSGFVSNSSSSSFLLIGVAVSSGTYQHDTIPGNLDFVDGEGEDDLVGVKFWADGWEEIPLQKFLDCVYQVKCALGEDANISVFFGEEACY